MNSEDKKVIFTKRNIILMIVIILIIIIGIVGCQYFKNKTDDPIPNPNPTIKATNISLTDSVVNLKIGESKQVEATIIPNNTTNKTLLYSSGNEEVAIVDGNGEITGVGEGETIVTVRIDDVAVDITVKVTKPEQNPGVTTKPKITVGSPSGTKGTNNWYISNVAVKVTSPTADIIKYCISANNECTPNKVVKSGNGINLTEGIWKIYIVATNTAGSTKTNTNLIYIDTTKPKIELAKTVTGKSTGVTAIATCSDLTSGVANCAGAASTPATVTGIKATTQYKVVDKAGNENTATLNITTSSKRYYRTCENNSFTQWVQGKLTCYDSFPGTDITSKSKPWAEANNSDTYYSCGVNPTKCGDPGDSCTKYTRTITGCSKWSSWNTTSCQIGDDECQSYVEKYYN